jgi:predicted phage gp36 major capsid-like protein
MSDQFNPQSHDSMFARILAEMQADRTARENFRTEVRDRFDKGAERMDALDTKIDAVHSETRKTNGRVTKLETDRKLILAKIAGATAIITALYWLHEKGLLATLLG